MQQVLKWVLSGLTCALLASCHHHEEITRLSEHTLLLYICGDNSLSNYADRNISACKEGLLNSKEPLNLIVYKDNNDTHGETKGNPCLFLLTVNEQSVIDTTWIKKWDKELDSTDPLVLNEVISTAFKNHNTQIKGLEIWGHGHSWLPGATWNPNASSRNAQYAGIDDKNYLEIWEMREAIAKSGIHLDYILFDACFMGSAEVAYELRNTCDWLIGAPCEIPAAGFPYNTIIEDLSSVNSGDKKNSLSQALMRCIDDYGTLYPDNSAVTLFDESQMETLHTAYKELIATHTEEFDNLSNSPYVFDQMMKHYGRSATDDRYHFYDLADFAQAAGGDLGTAINSVIRHQFLSGQYYDGAGTVKFEDGCGIIITPPQLFSIGSNPSQLAEGYKRIEWGLE